MNEKDLEQRLRSVVDGEQPKAPQSLRNFLREMPEAETQRRRGLLGWLRAIPGDASGSPRRSPLVGRAQFGFGLAAAVVIGLAAGGALFAFRQTNVPAASIKTTAPSPVETPRRSLQSRPSPIVASLGIDNLEWVGAPAVDNENMALPTQAIPITGGRYLGITDSPYGLNGLVRSDNGMSWEWSPPTDVNARAAVLTSIASDGVDTFILSGAAQGLDGTMDGRIYFSRDGNSWQEIADESIFRGVTLRTAVYGTGGFVVLGWNDATPADSLRQVAEWRSDDGRTWTRVTTPIKGTAALIVPTPAGFVLSGTPLAAGTIDEPPMWYSPDGQTWTRASATDNTAQKMGPLFSATVTRMSDVYAVSMAKDGFNRKLVASKDSGMTWHLVKPNDSLTHGSMISQVTSLSTADKEYLFAMVAAGEGMGPFLSTDGGTNWKTIKDDNVGGPAGSAMLEIGTGYQAGPTKIISFGKPGSGLGLWLGYLLGY